MKYLLLVLLLLTNIGHAATSNLNFGNLGVSSTGQLSEVWVHTANGYGATNTNTPRFTTTQRSTGSNISYSDSSTLGNSFTINSTGTYTMSGTWYHQSTNPGCGFTLNQATGTQGINNVSTSERLAMSGTQINTAGQDEYCHVSTTINLAAGDVIRFVTVGQTAATAARSQVRITQIR